MRLASRPGLCALLLLAGGPGALRAGADVPAADPAVGGDAIVDTLPGRVALAARSLNLPPESISLWVQRVDEPKPLVSVNADVPRNPASTMKLLTTFAALQRLGPAYTWETEVFVESPPDDDGVVGDLWLRGHGDPFLVTEEYWKLARDLRTLGIRRIDGDLVFDVSYFDVPREDRSAFDNQPDRVYNLPPHPLLVNFNAVHFRVQPEEDGRSVVVEADPPLPNLELENQLRLYQAPCGGYQRGVALSVQDTQRDQVLLEGRFPNGCRSYQLTRTVLQPETYAFGLFDLYWDQLGGDIEGRWRVEQVPEALAGSADERRRPFHVHRSRPLGDVLRLVNKFSNNVMTRHLELTLGAQSYGAPATEEKGLRAIFEVLGEQGVDTTGLRISNSAGLSRDSRVSARQLATVLQAAWRSPFMPEFVSSLAIPGLDGTLRRRLAGSPAEGRMHMKTGTLDHVSAVAGYVDSRAGERLIVVVLVNAAEAHRGLGEDLQDVVLRWVLDL